MINFSRRSIFLTTIFSAMSLVLFHRELTSYASISLRPRAVDESEPVSGLEDHSHQVNNSSAQNLSTKRIGIRAMKDRPAAMNDKRDTGRRQAERHWVVVFTDNDLCDSLQQSFQNWTILLASNDDKALKDGQMRGQILAGIPPAVNDRSCATHARVLLSFTTFFSRTTKCRYMRITTSSVVSGKDKTSAFLYAIQNGAEAIYILPTEGYGRSRQISSSAPTLDNTDGSLVVDSQLFFPAAHWGCTTFNTPGIYAMLNSTYKLHTCIKASVVTPAIQLVHSGDVTNHKPIRRLDCDARGPSVILSKRTSTYIGLEGSFVYKDAFWSLAFLSSGPRGGHRLGLNLVMQRISAMINQYIAVYLAREIPTQLTDFSRVHKVGNALNKFSCNKTTLLSCVNETLHKALQLGIIDESVHSYLTSWLSSLKDINKDENVHAKVDGRQCRIHAARFKPAQPDSNMLVNSRVFQNICMDANTTAITSPDSRFDRILLVVLFNNPLYKAIPHVEVLYRSHFPNILYCGPSEISEEHGDVLSHYNVSHVVYTHSGTFKAKPGAFNYQCLSLAVAFGYDVDGYLMIADDMVVFPDRLNSISRNHGWYKANPVIVDLNNMKQCRNGVCNVGHHWVWWGKYKGSVMKVLQQFTSHRSANPAYDKCLRTLESVNGDIHRVVKGQADIYYVPQRTARDVSRVLGVFHAYNTFLEIAVPTALWCLHAMHNLSYINGWMLWTTKEKRLLLSGKPEVTEKLATIDYFHPAKWSQLASPTSLYRKLFCYITRLVHNRTTD